MLGKTYLTKQASLLVKFARTTSDSELSAKLMSKAADLKAQADPMPDRDQGPERPTSVRPGSRGPDDAGGGFVIPCLPRPPRSGHLAVRIMPRRT